MKRASLLLIVASLGLLVAAPAVEAAPRSPFTGSWIGADPAPPDGDGSTVYLTISGGAVPRLSFTDLYGSICVQEGSPTVVFSSTLSGWIDGEDLVAEFTSARCGPVYFDWLVGGGVVYTYDGATDTISDGSVTFYRR